MSEAEAEAAFLKDLAKAIEESKSAAGLNDPVPNL